MTVHDIRHRLIAVNKAILQIKNISTQPQVLNELDLVIVDVCRLGDDLDKNTEEVMHFRNGREAKNGDKAIKLEGGKVVAFGVFYDGTVGNDYCNGRIAPAQPSVDGACLVDMLHIDDVEMILAEKGLNKRPEGK